MSGTIGLLLRRLLAHFIDFFIALPAAVLLAVVDSFPFLIAAILAYRAYFILATWRCGKTVGKWVMGLRVVQENGDRTIPLATSIYREAIWIGFSLLFVVSPPPFALWAGFAQTCYFLADIGRAWMSKGQRSLHDDLAKTKVVRWRNGEELWSET